MSYKFHCSPGGRRRFAGIRGRTSTWASGENTQTRTLHMSSQSSTSSLPGPSTFSAALHAPHRLSVESPPPPFPAFFARATLTPTQNSVLERSIDPETGIIRTERVIGCTQKAPSWIVKVSRSPTADEPSRS